LDSNGLWSQCYTTQKNKVVSQAALKKLQNHMWYLGLEMAPLSLFSCKASDDEKSIVEALILSGDDWNVRGIICPVAKCNELEKKQVHELVTSPRATLRSLGLDLAILSGHEPSSLKTITSFRKSKAVIAAFKVFNDPAEHSISLMSSFNHSIKNGGIRHSASREQFNIFPSNTFISSLEGEKFIVKLNRSHGQICPFLDPPLSITKTESAIQKLIQIVRDNRKRITDSHKNTMVAYAIGSQ